MDVTKPSALPVYLITEDRDHITLGRVTHSERGGSIRHCYLRGLWVVQKGDSGTLSYFTSDAPYFDMLSSASQKSCCLSQPALNSYWLLSGGVGVVPYVKPPTCQSRWTGGGTVRRHVHKPLPAPCSLLHTSRPSFCYGRGCCTLAFTKQPRHATLPDSTSLPSVETDKQAELSWEQTVVDCLTNTPSHQQDKVEETVEHMSQGKLWFKIHLISLSQWRTVGLDS